jgi:putative exosortase-associated protein (TIGR04073 family)
MIKSFSFLAVAAVIALFATGCAGPEKKLGRGFNNVGEALRWGELRRSREQAGVWRGRHASNGSGLISGFNKSIARIGVGVYEVVTFPIPIPSYDPMFTDYLSPVPAGPDSYTPGLADDPLFHTDTHLGFSGGDVAPIVPGSRFAIFRTP